jgi:hypothetical protein
MDRLVVDGAVLDTVRASRGPRPHEVGGAR